MAVSDDEEERKFFEELDGFSLHLPGNQQTKFADNESLVKMAATQCPGWKNEGNVTSVPIARIPKLFLRGFELSKQAEKQFQNTNRKGDDAERKLFQLLVNGSFADNAGIIVFPNFDSSHIFKTQIAKVETDVILVHSKKGIFIFNVKNAGTAKGFKDTKKIADHIKRHRNLVRMLMNYKPDPTADNTTPIHTIVCDFAASELSKFAHLENKTEEFWDKTIVLKQNDLNLTNFSETWQTIMLEAAIPDISWNTSLDLLVARLIALASIEGAAALIHEKMQKGLLQAVSQRIQLENQIDNVCADNQEMKQLVVENSTINAEEEKEDKKFILWTKDQMEVISTVYQHLVLNPEEGLRLLVTGGKGSGKTMLLIFLAKLAQNFLDYTAGETGRKHVLVLEGSFHSIGLTCMLREAFKSTCIAVFDPSAPTDAKTETPKRIAVVRDLLIRQSEGFDILLCDESTPHLESFLVKNLKPNQHLVMFSSLKTSPITNQLKTIVKHLGSCLRSTCQIARFGNSYIENGPKNILPAFPTNNLEGEPVDISFVTSDNSSDSLFLSKCFEAISEQVEKFLGIDFVLVVPFMETDVLKKLIQKLEHGNICCYSHLDSALVSDNRNQIKYRQAKPGAFFCDPFEIEGCEFPIVLILINARDLQIFSFTRYGNKLTTAITRASLKVKIVVNQCEVFEDEDVNTRLREQHDKDIRQYVEENCKTTEEKPTVLIVGKKPADLHLWREVSKERPVPLIDNISLYVGNQGSFLHLDDIYLGSDLQKLQEFGVLKILLTNECVSNLWSYFFVHASVLCIASFCYQNSKPFMLQAGIFTNKLMKYQFNLHLNFLRYQSGDATVKIPNFWLDFETEPIPKYHEDNWEAWRSKAEELVKLSAISQAVHMFEWSIKLFNERTKRRDNSVNSDDVFKDYSSAFSELATLSTTVSKLYLQHTSDIVEDTQFGGDFRELLEEDCIVKAFKNAMNAIKWKPCHMEVYDITEMVIKKIENLCRVSQRPTQLSQLANEDKLRKNIHAFRQSPMSPFTENPTDFQAQMQKLDGLISEYDAKRFTESNAALISMRKEISTLARNALELSLGIILKTDDLSIRREEELFQELFAETTQIFDYSIQLGLEALHWDPSNPKCIQTLLSALKRLELTCGRLKNASLGLA